MGLALARLLIDWPSAATAELADQRDQKLHYMRRPALQTIFEKADEDLDGKLNSNEFAVFLRLMAPKHAVHQLDKLQWLMQLAGAEGSKVTLPQLEKWLQPVQKKVSKLLLERLELQAMVMVGATGWLVGHSSACPGSDSISCLRWRHRQSMEKAVKRVPHTRHCLDENRTRAVHEGGTADIGEFGRQCANIERTVEVQSLCGIE